MARIWDADNGELAVLRGYDNWIRGVAWSPDGPWLATGSEDRTVKMCVVESAEIIIIGAPAGGVESVSWSPDGRRVTFASQDGICRVCEATTSIDNLVANAYRRVSRELTAEERVVDHNASSVVAGSTPPLPAICPGTGLILGSTSEDVHGRP